ncbi:MAG: hypothetical protein HRT87_06445 [Legionellales bacterium]|nr:hypothetical protein [Legionellales bacterium]
MDILELIKEKGYRNAQHFAVHNNIEPAKVYYWVKQSHKLGYNTRLKVEKIINDSVL